MIKYRVKKAQGGGWKVVRVRGLERATISYWPGHAAAMDAALEYAGLQTPAEYVAMSEPTC